MKTLIEKIKAYINIAPDDLAFMDDYVIGEQRGLNVALSIVENHTCLWRKHDVYFEDCIGLGWTDNERTHMKYCPYCMGRIIEETE